MTFSERMMVSRQITRAQLILEQLDQRNSTPGRKVKGKDAGCWGEIRDIATRQLGRIMAEPGTGATAPDQLPLKVAE